MLRQITARGGEFVPIDDTLTPTLTPIERCAGKANRPSYSGKPHRHGLRFLALTDERGKLLWISAAHPGRTYDATAAAARRDKVVGHLDTAGLDALADLGFIGVDNLEVARWRQADERSRTQMVPPKRIKPALTAKPTPSAAPAGMPQAGRRSAA
ncbi:transposase family protein [Streptomyces sp. NPDC059443]|uniref:transposase family protein n=1 Tax=unclassified Streptomyces TaxID=2593676 RepID=UPI00368DB069